MKNKLSALSVILAGVLWGTISIFVKHIAAGGYSSEEICFMRISSCAVLMFVFLLIYDRKLLKFKLKDIWMFIGTGILSLTLFSMCYFRTLISSGASVAVSLLYTSPAFIMILSFFIFKEKITVQKALTIVITVIGCALVSGFIGSEKTMTPLALIIGLGAGLFYALYSIFASYALKKYHPFTITFYTFVFAAISFIFIVKPSGISHVLSSSPDILIFGVLCGFIGGMLPYIFYTLGLKNLDPSVAGVLVAVEPLVGSVIGIIGYKEDAGIFKILGIILILAAIIISSLPRKNK